MNAVIAPREVRNWIGGSTIPAILGISPYVTPVQAYLKLIGQGEPETAEQLAFFKRRAAYEPLVREFVQEAEGVKIVRANERYTDTSLPFVRAEIDFETDDDGNGEIKTVHVYAAKDWGPAGGDECPAYVTAQAMWGLGVTGKKFARVVGLIGFDDLRIYRIERDDQLIGALRRRATAFWNDHVVPRIPPPATTREDNELLYPKDLGTTYEASEAVITDVVRLRETKAQIKTLKEREEEITERLAMFMQGASILSANNTTVATYKQQTQSRFDQKAFEAAHPDLAAQFRKTLTFRTFRLK